MSAMPWHLWFTILSLSLKITPIGIQYWKSLSAQNICQVAIRLWMMPKLMHHLAIDYTALHYRILLASISGPLVFVLITDLGSLHLIDDAILLSHAEWQVMVRREQPRLKKSEGIHSDKQYNTEQKHGSIYMTNGPGNSQICRMYFAHFGRSGISRIPMCLF